VLPHHARKSHQLLDRLTLGAHGQQQADDVAVRHAARQQLLHQRFGLGAREIASGFECA
jgi:hypothetical protein